MNNPDTEGVINSINEFTQYVAEHGTIADGFRADIDANEAAIEELKDYVGELPAGSEFVILPETTYTFNEGERLVKEISLNIKDGWRNAFSDSHGDKTVIATVNGVEYECTPACLTGGDNSICVGASSPDMNDGIICVSAYGPHDTDELQYNNKPDDVFPVTLTVSIKYVEGNGTSATNVVDYINEVVGSEATRAATAENDLSERINALESNMGTEGSVSDQISAAIATETAARDAAIAEVQADATKGIEDAATAQAAAEAAQAAAEAEAERAEAAEAGIIERVAAVEAKFGDGEGSVADMIADAKQEAIDAAAAAADAKDAEILAQAKADSDSKDAVVLVEAQKAAAAVQTALDTHTGNADIHVTTADKTKWNAALQAADITSGAANGTIAVKGTDVAVTGLGTAAYKADTAFDAAGSASAAEAAAKTYTDEAVAKFVECSEEEINALFA